MLRELVEKAEKLESEGKLNPLGYDKYSEPIKWVIHIYPDRDRIEIEEYAGENGPRAKPSTRSGKKAYPCPFADEAGYVLGVAKHKDGEIDSLAAKKHQAYLELLKEMALSSHFSEPLLREALLAITQKLQYGSIQESFEGKAVFNKTWVTFVYEKGHLAHQQLHELPQTNSFWAHKVAEDVGAGEEQFCSVCGSKAKTVKNLPTKVMLKGGGRQLASFNENAFVSYRFSEKNASLGICLPCAEKSSQAMNYLLKHNSNDIYEDKNASGMVNNDSPRNQIAVYWLKNDTWFSIEEQEYNLDDLFSIPMDFSDSIQVETTEELVNKFLKSPWTGQRSTLNVDENTFYLAVLSPNKGRIAFRDWFQVSAGEVKANLINYFEALSLIDTSGRKGRPYTFQQLLEPLEDVDPNMAKTLVRSAYLGEKPPFSLLQAAVRRIRISGARDGSLESDGKHKKRGLEPVEVWQRLCTIIKFCLTFREEDTKSMETLNRERKVVAYQIGRLLAVLEEIQRRAAGGTLSSTLVDRYYGSASTAP
ncbi:MAG: hypothetical protein GX425_01500, partial [Peptococcaceae bacterium]|nr:hypothetical protein [Peptococcaceae bacterium]